MRERERFKADVDTEMKRWGIGSALSPCHVTDGAYDFHNFIAHYPVKAGHNWASVCGPLPRYLFPVLGSVLDTAPQHPLSFQDTLISGMIYYLRFTSVPYERIDRGVIPYCALTPGTIFCVCLCKQEQWNLVLFDGAHAGCDCISSDRGSLLQLNRLGWSGMGWYSQTFKHSKLPSATTLKYPNTRNSNYILEIKYMISMSI